MNMRTELVETITAPIEVEEITLWNDLEVTESKIVESEDITVFTLTETDES